MVYDFLVQVNNILNANFDLNSRHFVPLNCLCWKNNTFSVGVITLNYKYAKPVTTYGQGVVIIE